MENNRKLHDPVNSKLQNPSFRGGEAIILAGGLGTRLRSVVSDMPKCMAPVAGKPFLHYVIDHLQKQGVEKFIFALGHLYEQVTGYLDQHHPEMHKRYSIEQEPLGTGGAIKLACSSATEKTVVVVNGDTLFRLDLVKLTAFHNMCGADCTISLKPMTNFNRYGVVEINKDYSIGSFKEKKAYASGLINAGIYALNTERFIKEELPDKFSFEQDYLEKYCGMRRFYAVVQDSYFIDIGIPEDYDRAQLELKVEK